MPSSMIADPRPKFLTFAEHDDVSNGAPQAEMLVGKEDRHHHNGDKLLLRAEDSE